MASPEARIKQLRARLVGNERINPEAGRSYPLVLKDAAEYEAIKGEVGGEVMLFGYPLAEALVRGFEITRRSVFEMTDFRAAVDSTRRLVNIFDRLSIDPTRRIVFDAFAGTGQVSFALAQEFPEVYAAEQDPTTYHYLVQNLLRLTTRGKMKPLYANSVDFLGQARENQFAGIYIDPPWNKSGQLSFTLDQTLPPADDLARLALKKSPVAALKLPVYADWWNMDNFALSEGLHALVDEQISYPANPTLNQLTVYFTKQKLEEPNVGARLTHSPRYLVRS